MTIVDVVVTLVVLGSIGGSAGLLAACIPTDGIVSYLLLAYVIAWSEAIAVVLLLSPLGLVTTAWLTGALLVCLAAAVATWSAKDRPRPPALREVLKTAREAIGDPAIRVLAVVVGCAWVYTLALGLFTPPREWDSLAYHLPRVAFWLQQNAVGYVPHANDPRLNANPPGAEIGVLTTMAASGGDRLVALPQLSALVVLVLGVAGIARRIGLSPRAAVFGALIFATLPIVAVQAPTTYNDLVVASFLVAFGYAALRARGPDLLIASASLALALTTKLTTVVALPVIALVALAACPRGRRLRLAGASLVGLLLGSPWYVVNLAHTGHADGALASATAQTQDFSLIAIAPTIRRHLFSLIDFSGARGIPTGILFDVVAAVTIVIGVAWGVRRRTPRRGVRVGATAALVVLSPLVVALGARLAIHAWYKLWLILDRRDIAVSDDSWQIQVASDAALSWFGPVATVLLIGATFVVLRDVRRRRLPLVAGVLAIAPLLFIVALSILVPWDPWRGRFVVFAVAFAAATWGATLRYRPLVWGATALAVVTLPLSLLGMYTKPAGLPLLEGTDGRQPSVWTASQSDLLAYLAQRTDVGAAIEAADAAGSATLAAAVRDNEFLYPFFGNRLERTVRLVDHVGGVVPGDATWLVAAPGASITRCGSWKRVFSKTGWIVERRVDNTTQPCLRVTTVAGDNPEQRQRQIS
jgi:hypothetical protein